MRPSLLALAAAASLAIKLALAINTHGTNDMVFYELCLAKDRAEGALALFRDGIPLHGAYANTAFMIHALHGWDWLANHTGLPFRFWFRATGAVADLASLGLVYKMIQPAAPMSLLLALSPLSIFISGFHGTTDPIHVALTLLTVFVQHRYSRPWLTGAVLALAMSIKVIPLIFIPTILFSLPTLRKRAEFLTVLAAVFSALSLPYIAQDPMLIVGRIFGYRSLYGFWGFPRLLSLLEAAVPAAAPLSLLYFGLGRFVILLAVTYVGEGLQKVRTHLFTKISLVAFFFMTFTPGFGIQYLAWLVPWTACVSLRASLAYHLIGAAFVATVYTAWSGGLPWYLADSSPPTFWGVGWRGPARILELATWVIVIWMWRQTRDRLKQA